MSFCPLPWSHCYVESQMSRICCLSSKVDNGLDINSPDRRRIRLQMLEGKRPSECSACYKIEDDGLTSYRNRCIDNSPLTKKKAAKLTNTDGYVESAPSSIDIRMSSICNLACVMCGPEISTRWIQDRDIIDKVEPGKGFIKLNTLKGEPLLELPHLIMAMCKSHRFITIHVAGGEPFADKKVHGFLNFLVDSDLASQIELQITTNGTLFNQKYCNFNSFKKVIFNLSIDGIGNINDYIRYPSKFHQLEEMITKVEKSKHSLNFAFTMSALNVDHFDLFYDIIGHKHNMILNVVETPHYLKVDCLPQPLIESVKDSIDPKKSRHHAVIYKYLSRIETKPYSTEVLKQYLELLDGRRGTSYEQTFPKIFKHLAG